jgi:hypothetical protein
VVVALAEGAARPLAQHLVPVEPWPDTAYSSHDELLSVAGDDLDLLVVGSSSVGIAIRPGDLTEDGAAGLGYNYWLAGTPMRSVELLTREVLLDRSSPSTVIIGVTMREFTSTLSLDTHLAALEASPAFRNAAGRQAWLDPLDDWLQRHSALARHRAAFRDPIKLKDELLAPATVPDLVEGDGHIDGRGDNSLADEPADHLAQERAAMAHFTVAPAEVTALGDLLDELHQRGIRALVVNLPVTDQFIGMADGGQTAYDSYVTVVEDATLSHHGEWLDAMQQSWPDRYFGDVSHVNELGIQELRPMVVAALQARGSGG